MPHPPGMSESDVVIRVESLGTKYSLPLPQHNSSHMPA
jgi:hypothetical protein